jgi:hypothetical protein
MLCFFDFPGSQAACADLHPFRSAFDFRTYRNKVRFEHSVVSVLSMTDIMTGHTFFSANLTFSRHYKTSLIFSNKDYLI